MRRQRTAVHKAQEVRQRLLELRRVSKHGVGDTGQADDLRRQTAVGVHKGLEPLRDLTVFQHHRTDLRDGLPVHFQSGGLDVKADEFVIQAAVLGAVDYHPVVNIVDKIALHAVKDFYFIPRGMPGVWEGLGHAVVRDGDGGMTPADGLLDDLLGVRQCVHIAHLRVEMQLHTLHRGGVLPLLMLNDIDVVGIKLDVLAVPGRLHLALDAQPHTGLDGALQALGLLGGQILLDSDRVGVVRHVKAQPPHTGPPGLPALKGEHLAADRGGAHFQIQFLHGTGSGLDGVAHQHLPHRGLAALGGGRRRLHGRGPDRLRSLAGHIDVHTGETVHRPDGILYALKVLL